MSPAKSGLKRTFTIDEANAMLPLVRAIVSDLSVLAKELRDRQTVVAVLQAQRGSRSSDVYSEEVEQVERELEKGAARMAEYVQELEDLGVEPKSAIDGLVDFPAVVDGQLAYLCWRLGEAEVAFWHTLDAGFAGRQPLTADSLAGPEEDSSDSDFAG